MTLLKTTPFREVRSLPCGRLIYFFIDTDQSAAYHSEQKNMPLAQPLEGTVPYDNIIILYIK